MKVLLLTLLLLLCSTQVLTLTCYTCEGDVDCKTETNCPENTMFCKTFINDTLSRTCEIFCVEDDYTSCCNTNLCTSSN